MSHCSTFEVHFKDKHLLFKALRNLDLHPENYMWAEYSSHFTKKLNIGGSVIGKLLTATYRDIHIFFTQDENGLQLNTESPNSSGQALEQAGNEIFLKIQREYMKCAVMQLANRISSLGGSTSVTENITESSYSIKLSLDAGIKNFTLDMNNAGLISERVSGVVGRSCTDLTQNVENLLSSNVNREWTYEYDTMLEDEEVQVLKLNQI